MRTYGLVLILLMARIALCGHITLATTSVVKESGLLDRICAAFERESGIVVRIVAASQQDVLALGMEGKADVLLMKALYASKELANGSCLARTCALYDDFVIVGPRDDPVHVRWQKTAARAFSRIAADQAFFVSRGDSSDTHKKEEAVWHQAGHTPNGTWYLPVCQSMAAVLMIASEKQAYALADRPTFVALKTSLDLEVVFEGDSALCNQYDIIAVKSAHRPPLLTDRAVQFVRWFATDAAQELIAEPGGVFFPVSRGTDACQRRKPR
ncbi:MAG: tungsten ABC transporter substrate-binding protein [Chitinivibrionales bacterium]|nr:tungsten ABC transporter substrate-binding protein [Chitinivibrionales bacterium]MBD3395595.1 tungsten ABC transporter substrate-binding protein [Chitinivibrionales bacterium]